MDGTKITFVEWLLPTNFTKTTNIYRCAMCLSPTDNTDFLDIYLHSLFDWLFCYAKNRSADNTDAMWRFYIELTLLIYCYTIVKSTKLGNLCLVDFVFYCI